MIGTLAQAPASGPAPTSAFAPPRSFDGYLLSRKIGQGNMGQVFLAVDTLLDRPVAGAVDHRAVAKMHAVEIAHGDGGTPGVRVKPLEVLMNLHPRPFGAMAPSVELAARRQD